MEQINKIELRKGDCLELMKDIKSGSVDLILTDPPYGTVKDIASGDNLNFGMKNKTKWDTELDIDKMFFECERILRENGKLILFGQEPYTSKLIINSHNNLPFNYRMIWLKDHFANALIAKVAPVNYFEDVLLFSKRYDTLNLNPLREYARDLFKHINLSKKQIFINMGNQSVCHFMRTESMQFGICTEKTYNDLIRLYNIDTWENFINFKDVKLMNKKHSSIFNLEKNKLIKSNVLEYKKDYGGLHPTQKPLKLFEDLIKTYSNEDDLILDFTAGSGTTGIACQNLNRNCIMIEKDENYCEIILKRLKEQKTLLSYK